MSEQQWQQEAEEIEDRDDSAQNKGRAPLLEEVSPMGQRVLHKPKDSFTATAESQLLDQEGKPDSLLAEKPDPPPIKHD